MLKNKYQNEEYGLNDYIRENVHNAFENQKVRQAFATADIDENGKESGFAVWLKENHPYVHYLAFYDESVLPESYFNTEYRLITDKTENGGDVFYPINKTTHDYAKYLVENGIFTEPEREAVLTEQEREAVEPAPLESPNVPKNEIPVYKYTLRDSIERRERKQAVESMNLNRECAAAIEQAIIERSVSGTMPGTQHVDTEAAARAVVDEFGVERVGWILGNNLKHFDYDRRYSNENKEWAKTFDTANAEMHYFILDTHPTILDTFVRKFRALEQEIETPTITTEKETPSPNDPPQEPRSQGTPLWRDYQFIKNQHPNEILLYRLGDFYESFGDDARLVSDALQIALTARDMGMEERIPMVGVPQHTLDGYIERLADAGYDVVIRHGRDDIETRNRSIPQTEQSTPTNFRITDPHLGEGGAKTKYAYNIEAIKTLQAIETENRHATPDEQAVLSRFVGWGGLQEAFDDSKLGWVKEYKELKDLLSPEEYETARASVLNAHYTSPAVISAMYEALERMGVTSGNILEPAMGVGNFFGLLPESMQNAKLYGVELDSVTGRIAKQLYPQADIKVMGFEKTSMPDSFFDVAVGNVPFGGFGVVDKKYDKHKFMIHDYFFAKTLDQVRPGGIVAFVTSKGTLDKVNPSVRKYLAQRADLLGAVRLPNNAFLKNAGTEVTSDIIFLQRRENLRDIEPPWVHLEQIPDALNPEKDISINTYFADNPHMIIGNMTAESGLRMYGNENTTTCTPIEGADLNQQLKEALFHIEGQITPIDMGLGVNDVNEVDVLDLDASAAPVLPADPSVKNFSYTLVDDTVYFRENSIMRPVDMPAATLERIKGMVGLRDTAKALIDIQLFDGSDEQIAAMQGQLNSLYDNFTKKHGLINTSANARAFNEDSSYYLLASLEVLDENGELERKSDIFTKRTIKQEVEIYSVDTAAEALAVSISRKGKVDMPYMAELAWKTEEEIAQDLQGVIFKDLGGESVKGGIIPSRDELQRLCMEAGNEFEGYKQFLESRPYITADAYLSGNVREKLGFAKSLEHTIKQRSSESDLDWGALSPQLAVNIAALEDAQPKELDASEIAVRLGATWVDKDYYQQFAYEVLETPYYQKNAIKVNYSDHTGEWNISGKTTPRYDDVKAYTTYGTKRANAYAILEQSLNLRDIRVYDIKYEHGKEIREVNKKETTLAMQKQDALKEAFKDWIFKDPDRRQALVSKYNKLFNSTRTRQYDGSHIEFAGASPEITLRPHQRGAIARILYGGNTLLAHEVGAGKSFEMIGAAMESKRLGLCSKSMMVVPNHIIEDMAAEFMRLYPSANILVASKKDFEPKNRKKFCARIATGDYDCVIIGHSQFEKIPLSAERQERLLREQIDDLTAGIEQVKRDKGEHFTIKQMEKSKKNLEIRLEKLMDDSRKDDVVTFEQLGVNRLFIDEAHNYKNLFLITKMRNVAGLSTSEAQKSSDLFMKCRYLDEETGNKGVIFATGTPISNSLAEMYTMQRYLQYDTLQDMNLGHFDAWASTFAETVTAVELAPEGTGYRARTRFAKFQNLPELMTLFGEVADIKTADTLDLPRPKANFHTIVAKPTDIQKDMVKALSERATAVQNKQVDPSEDNMLKITSDGRKIGLDQRMMNPMLPDDPNSKVNLCMENVYRIWDETAEDRLTQLVFCDFSTPNKDGRFNVYDDIRDKLVAKGVPENEIAFIHDFNTEAQKKELFAKVRSGKVRVLFGSTAKCGSGTNVQDKLIALHDLDCPWRPADLAQRAGRIERQGNNNPEVDIFRYVTEGTFDSYLFQTVQKKQEFISQIMTSKSPVRTCDDMDEQALSYAEIKALCAGNPLIAEKMGLDVEVAKLKMFKAHHQSQQYQLEDNLRLTFPKQIESSKLEIAGYKADMSRLEANTHKGFEGISPMKIGAFNYTERKDAGTALIQSCHNVKGTTPEKVGDYRGFDMYVYYEPLGSEYKCFLKGAMSHTVSLGIDPVGNITRIDNALERIAMTLDGTEANLQTLYSQVENAKQELAKPFPLEDELTVKSARLTELDALLSMDGNDAPEEQTHEGDAPEADIPPTPPPKKTEVKIDERTPTQPTPSKSKNKSHDER
ncbi:MAG: DUF3849 domain-containing protein [Defluviitaleaceae bacterium]|nr:DUF3849 domain-containing protein [Defluviitaleaceae bacterium]